MDFVVDPLIYQPKKISKQWRLSIEVTMSYAIYHPGSAESAFLINDLTTGVSDRFEDYIRAK